MRVHSPSGRPHRKFADNYFMMEVGLPGGDFAKAMAKQKAFMGPSGRRGGPKFG